MDDKSPSEAARYFGLVNNVNPWLANEGRGTFLETNPSVSLRLGDTLAYEVSRRRRLSEESLGAVIRRDLERYYLAARETVLRFHFTRSEATILLRALDGERDRVPRFLWAVVAEWLKCPTAAKLPAEYRDEDKTSTLIEKLRGMSPLDAHAVYDAVDLYDREMERGNQFRAFLASGLTLEVFEEDKGIGTVPEASDAEPSAEAPPAEKRARTKGKKK